MIIAILVDRFPVLSERFVLDQIIGLINRGHEVDVYSREEGPLIQMQPEVLEYKLLDRTHRLRRVLQVGRLLKHLGIPIPFLKQRPYDIIHCQFGPDGLKGLLLQDIGFLQGKLIISFRGYDVSKYSAGPNRRVYDQLFERGELFLAVSQHIKHRLIELGCDEKKILVHRTGIDCSKFRFAPRKLDETEEVRLVTIARLVEKKGLEYAIRAVAKLVSGRRKIHYDIIGDGVLRDHLQRLVHQLGLADTVRLLGWKSQQEVIEILERSHIFISPSVTAKDGDQEGIPNALKEAMAMGLPVIGTAHAGIPELIIDGVSGFLVPEWDIEALVEKVTYLIEHIELWPEIGRAGRAIVEQHYDMNKLSEELVEIYQLLLRP